MADLLRNQWPIWCGISTYHYIGTIVLSEVDDEDNAYYVVDGQQRIATITMIINALVRNLKKIDKDFYFRFFIKDEKYRLKPLSNDAPYFIDLLNHKRRQAENKNQKLLEAAYGEIQTQVDKIRDKMGFLRSIERLELMEFVEKSEGDAIRIFQTVNDRGKPLSNMEKAKSLLVYYSNRYLGKRLDNTINERFGQIFELYDDIKEFGEDNEINLISRVEFNEDDIMRYHFITFSDENYEATANYVLDYLKRSIAGYRSNEKENNFSGMEKFILNYVTDLKNFFESLKNVLARTQNDEKYLKLFSILGVSATLYPLIVKLELLGILSKKLPDYNDKTFIDLIEMIDVRVYKTRGTDPRADIFRYAYEIDESKTEKEIQNWLLEYNARWMSKERFQIELNSDIYGNRALPHMFIDYCEQLNRKKYSLNTLRKIMSKRPTIEHILAQTPHFKYKVAGFKNEKEFLEFNDRLGNLTVLEKQINSAVQNKHPIEKVQNYDKSLFVMTKKVSSLIAGKKDFKKDDILKRTDQLSEYCVKRWWC